MASANRLNLALGAALVLAVGAAYWLGRQPGPGLPAPGGVPATTTPAAGAASATPGTGFPEAGAMPAPLPISPELRAAGEAIDAENWVQAKAILEGVRPDNPAYASALYNLGILHDRMKQPEAALATFRKLTEVQPDNPDTWVSLGWAHWSLGDALAAENATLRALEYQTDNVVARYNVALYRLAQGRTHEALSSYERAFRLDRNQTGYSTALHDVRAWADAHPDRPEGSLVLAFFFKVIGEYGLETRALESFLATAPASPEVASAQARLEVAREKAREAGLLVPNTPSPAPSATAGSETPAAPASAPRP